MPWRPLAGPPAMSGRTSSDDWQLRFWATCSTGSRPASSTPRHRLRDGAGLARSRRLAAVAAHPRRLVSPLRRPRPVRSTETGRCRNEPPSDEAPDVSTYQPDSRSDRRRWPLLLHGALRADGPADQDSIERTKFVLVYTSQPLERDITLVGDVHVTLLAATSAPDTDFTARLCIVEPPASRRTSSRASSAPARASRSATRPRSSRTRSRVPDRPRACRPPAYPQATGCDSRSGAPTSRSWTAI